MAQTQWPGCDATRAERLDLSSVPVCQHTQAWLGLRGDHVFQTRVSELVCVLWVSVTRVGECVTACLAVYLWVSSQ